MGFPQSSLAYADLQRPRPWAICDRCGFRYFRDELVWQHDWRGPTEANLRILVCTRTCLDESQPQLRTILVGPDPIPVIDARPGFQATQQGYTPVFTPLELVSDSAP